MDESIRRAEIAGVKSGIAAARQLRPGDGAESIEVGGGIVAFTGVESPLSQAFGVGAVARVRPADVAAITAFYDANGTTPRVLVSPLADIGLGRALAQGGYAPVEYENVLACDDLSTFARRDERISIASDLRAWARASATAFTDCEELKAGDDFIALLIASSADVVALQAIENGRIVATAAMDLREGCAALFAGSTASSSRQRGWHITMIRDRIARAAEDGARFLRATAKPGTVSERNFHRCGFQTLYTRALWERQSSAV